MFVEEKKKQVTGTLVCPREVILNLMPRDAMITDNVLLESFFSPLSVQVKIQMTLTLEQKKIQKTSDHSPTAN